MINIDLDKLDEHVLLVRRLLKGGLISLDIWDRESFLGLSSYQQMPEIAALMSSVLDKANNALDGSSMKPVGKFIFIPLQSDQTLLMLKHRDDILEAMLLDLKNVNLGMIFSVLIPRSLGDIEKARVV